MPPKLTRSWGSLRTGMISGKPSMPLTKGYSMGWPKRRASARKSAGGEVLAAEEDDVVVEPDAADLRNFGVGGAGEVDAVDLGADGAGEADDVERHRWGPPVAARMRVGGG